MTTAMTVRGPVPADALGAVLMHEHLICDLLGPDRPSTSPPIELDNYYEARVDRSRAVDKVLDEPEVAIRELREFGVAGGGTLVDVTSEGLGRDPHALRRISEAADVHVVMGSGFYVQRLHPEIVCRSDVATLQRRIEDDLTVGVEGSGIRAGVIGEIGMSWPPHEDEIKVLTAAARASRETGAALMVHPGRHSQAPAHHLDLVARAGGTAGRTVMCHVDRTLFDVATMISLAERGCVLEFDLFGTESSYYPLDPSVDLPNDAGRVRYVKALIDAGFEEQITISEDVCRKTQLRTYGGEGYDHILRRVVPLMLRRGIDESTISTIMWTTPRRLLAYLD